VSDHDQAKQDQENEIQGIVKRANEAASCIDRNFKKMFHGLPEDLKPKVKTQVLVTLFEDGRSADGGMNGALVIHHHGFPKSAGTEAPLSILSRAITSFLDQQSVENQITNKVMQDIAVVVAGAPKDDEEENPSPTSH
jgi:hypothetical protein